MKNLLRSLFFSLLLFSSFTFADVVKPALVEISIFTDEHFEIEIRTSIEALLTGINAKYKNTKYAPTADEYQKLRELAPEDLKEAFIPFHTTFKKLISLTADKNNVAMTIKKVEIPLPGYVKVPRTSTITLVGTIPRSSKTIEWKYPAKFGDNAVRVRQVDIEKEKWHWSSWQWLKNDEISKPFSLEEVFTKASLTETLVTYIVSGFEHILPKGLDHILFILGIFLLSIRMKSLLWQVTMFTVAHSITLGLSMAGYITLPANIVEPLIALSIAYIGFENIYHQHLHKGRLVIVFIFGLLHGLGFASVLAEFGMPKDDFLTALISFNVGVELGQLTIITLAYVLVAHWFKNKDWYRARVIIPASLLIAVTGLYWTYDRIVF
jgi:hydrogenase/urease accessory protein HupE